MIFYICIYTESVTLEARSCVVRKKLTFQLFLSSCLISSIQRDRLSIQLHCTSRKLDVGDYPARLEEKEQRGKKKKKNYIT